LKVDNQNNYLPIQKLFLLLIIVFSVCQYAYSVAKLPFSNNSPIDFGHFYYYSTVLSGFEASKNTATERDIFYTLLGDSVNAPSKSWDHTTQIVPHAWGNAPHTPIFYILMRLFTQMDFKLAAFIWLILNQVFLIAGVALCTATIKKKISLFELAVITFLTADFLPLAMNNEGGQINILVFLLISLAAYCHVNKHDKTAGLALGFAVLMRWYPALLILYFIFKGRWKVVLGSFIMIAVGFMISIWKFGLLLHIVQFKYMPKFYFDYVVTAASNVSLSGFFYRLLVQTIHISTPYPTNLGDFNFAYYKGILDNHFLAASLTIISILTFMTVTFFNCRNKTQPNSWRFLLEYCLVITLLPIISTCSTSIFCSIVLTVFIFLFFYFSQTEAKPIEYLMFILAYILIGMKYWLDSLAVFQNGWMTIFLSGRLYGMIILWALILKLLSQKEKNNQLIQINP
jgi:hypothetical protein